MSMRFFEIAHLEYGQVCEAVGLHPLGSILDGKEVKDGFLESFGFVFETSRPGIIGRCRFAFHTIHLAARGWWFSRPTPTLAQLPLTRVARFYISSHICVLAIVF